MDWYLKVLCNYFYFSGRARRKEYWMFILVNFILACVLAAIDGLLGLHIGKNNDLLSTLYGIGVFIPSWAVQFRRLHDTDRSAWWLLVLLIPLVGWIMILVFNCQRGSYGPNRFGNDPLTEA